MTRAVLFDAPGPPGPAGPRGISGSVGPSGSKGDPVLGISAFDHGFVADGLTDNSPIFAALMDKLASGTAGTRINFPAGVYRFNSMIGGAYSTPGAIPMGVKIIGASQGGAFKVGGATIFDFYGPGTAIRAWSDIAVRTQTAGISFENIRIRGRLNAGAPTQTFISTTSSPSPTLKGWNSTSVTTKLRICTGGVLGTATFQYSLDNGGSWSATTTTPVNAFGPAFQNPSQSVRMGTTELHLNFPPGTYVANDASYQAITVAASDFFLTSPTTGPTIQVSGEVAQNFTGCIKVTTGGALATAAFALSLDGGATYGTPIATPSSTSTPVILFPTGQKAYFQAGTYVLNEVYPTWSGTVPNYNRIAIENILGAGINVRDCVITGFRYAISHDGSEDCFIEHVSSSAIETEASDGYQDLLSDIGTDSSAGVRYVIEVSGLTGNTNAHGIDSCDFNGSFFGTIHDDGVGQYVARCNYEVPGAIALMKGGQQVRFSNITSEGAYKAGFYCRRSTLDGIGSTYALTLENIDFVGRSNVPLINCNAGNMAINGLSIDQIQANSSPAAGAIINSQYLTGFWAGVIQTPFGTPICDNYEGQLSGIVGTTINHHTLPQAAIDVAVVDFSKPSYRFGSSPTHVFNERGHSANNGGYDYVVDRTYHPSSARRGAENSRSLQVVAMPTGTSTTNLCALDTPTFCGGTVRITVQAVREDDLTKTDTWCVRQLFYNTGSGPVLLGAATTEYSTSNDATYVAPTIAVSGTTLVATITAHPAHDSDWAAKLEILAAGY